VVWKEGEREMEDSVPSVWISKSRTTLRWPTETSREKFRKLFMGQRVPEENWLQFPIIKIKVTSGKSFFTFIVSLELYTPRDNIAHLYPASLN
jgi:hypothetical protein